MNNINQKRRGGPFNLFLILNCSRNISQIRHKYSFQNVLMKWWKGKIDMKEKGKKKKKKKGDLNER